MPEEEEEKVVKGDEVIVELDASLEDLYMGGSFKVLSVIQISWFFVSFLKKSWHLLNSQVWREKNVIKPAPGKRQCNCRNEVYHRQIAPGMFQQMTEQVGFED